MSALSGKSVVVTGAGSGLGAAYARHAASLGANVVVNDIDVGKAEQTAAAIRHAGGSALAHADDVARWETAQILVDLCTSEFGTLSGFVANAGILHHGPIMDADERDLRRMLEINLLGDGGLRQRGRESHARAGYRRFHRDRDLGSQAGGHRVGRVWRHESGRRGADLQLGHGIRLAPGCASMPSLPRGDGDGGPTQGSSRSPAGQPRDPIRHPARPQGQRAGDQLPAVRSGLQHSRSGRAHRRSGSRPSSAIPQ